ncbi:MAG: DUF47 domain-containing protein [Candidatus Eisenbacteria bacterium]|uniref:DUF47 domain-containing protein n=1 Tax=Eiseniibacteriota bacterium TaxID=2212470 RepID=A0A849SJD9_UNCEI|nr:DUF47 domain-containing protein [Candidatus Eisenbacteria bacterium]
MRFSLFPREEDFFLLFRRQAALVSEGCHRTFVTPLEREDIHNLASGLDDVLDAAEAIASRVVLFKILAPTPEAVQLTAIVEECGVQIERAVEHLESFKNLRAFTIEINRLEREADHVSRQAVAELFSGRHDLLDILRWKEIYGRLENAADRCEDVANTVEAIVLKSR